ncbi:hypothetical protein PanWU01x14_306540 [Parasponia andersonii]|uniref:Uncharacterized protein n=1 Tax=Parasponia andersonii TaxID=3476 RepID=A0A2P5ARU2_PARAD|nr:hypothetical protein PanWU01x14_306540 [Parasponia andersonii]
MMAFEEFIQVSPARPAVNEASLSNRIEHPQRWQALRGRDASPPPPQPDLTFLPVAPIPIESMSPTPSPNLNIPDQQGSIKESFLEMLGANLLSNPSFLFA